MQSELILIEFKRRLRIKKFPLKEIRSYLQYANIFLNNVTGYSSLNDISNQEIEDYVFENVTNKQVSAVFQKRMIASIEKLFMLMENRQLSLAHLITSNSSSNLPSYFTKEEIKKIFDATDNLKHKTLLMLIYSCGLRVGEVLNLKVNDINFIEKKLYVFGVKSNQVRNLDLAAKMIEKLQNYFEVYKVKKYVFEGNTGEKYSPRSVQLTLKKAVRKAKLKNDGSVHTLRHSYAVHLLHAGIEIEQLKNLLGHENLSTTMIYLQVANNSKSQKWSPLDFL